MIGGPMRLLARPRCRDAVDEHDEDECQMGNGTGTMTHYMRDNVALVKKPIQRQAVPNLWSLTFICGLLYRINRMLRL